MKLGLYDLACTTVYAARNDPRFSYCLYVPPGFAPDPSRRSWSSSSMAARGHSWLSGIAFRISGPTTMR
jgi:hypothetical protein